MIFSFLRSFSSKSERYSFILKKKGYCIVLDDKQSAIPFCPLATAQSTVTIGGKPTIVEQHWVPSKAIGNCMGARFKRA